MKHVFSWLKEKIDVRVFISTIVALSLLGYVVNLVLAPEYLNEMWQLVLRVWPVALVLAIPYLTMRFYVWWRLLKILEVRVNLKQAIVSYSLGEIAKTLPFGDYLQSFTLNRFTHLKRHFLTRSYTATTAIFGLESVIAVPLLLIIGIPGFYWLGWVLGGIIVIWLLAFFILWLLVTFEIPRIKHLLPSWVMRLREIMVDAFRDVKRLFSLQTAKLFLPASVYFLAYAADLYVIIHSAGFRYINFADTLAIFSLAIIVILLVPVTVELGVVEFSGLGALVAYEIPVNSAAVIMLTWRILTTGANILIIGIILFILRDEFLVLKKA